MKKIIVILTLTMNAIIFPQSLVKYVNTFIGTDGHGHTYPGASLPFGLVQLSPDTDIQGWDWCSGYHYSDNSIIGFSHTHLSGTGCADYGDILLMPTTGILQFDQGTKTNTGEGYRSKFKHENESASPGFYSVLLDDYNIKVELTVSKRAGFHKYIFPKSNESNIILDLKHGIENRTINSRIEIIGDKVIQGYKRAEGWAKDKIFYFYAEFSKPFNKAGIVRDNKITDTRSLEEKDLKAFIQFSTDEGEAVLVKVGLSSVSIEGAKNNLLSEIPNWDFEKVKLDAEREWGKELSKIKIESGNENDKISFYTALYHSLLNPNTYSDIDGKYNGMDKKLHTAKDFDMYTVFSLWDTFRAAHPLFTIIEQKRALDMVKSLLAKYDESGLLPIWELSSNETGTMIGYHSIPVIVDAYFKGIKDFDLQKALDAMKNSAEQNHLGLEYYKQRGFIGAENESESVSKTLEYAYDDWCIAKFAKAIGRDEDHKNYLNRAMSYVNLFDPSTSLMRPKRNGRWQEPFDPYAVTAEYTEANAWQYSFFVPQDVNGLIDLMGGDEKFCSKLLELFTTEPKLTGREQADITGLIGQYAHGNEPSHHMAYLFNYAGQPWHTQFYVKEIMRKLYFHKPDGLCGNEDCGQMSSWYVFSAIGFYPVTPGDDIYVIGSPLFNKAEINLDGNKKFIVTAKNLSDENIYIQSAKLNGKEYRYSFIKHSDIMDGGEIEFIMGSEPGKDWGTNPEFRPSAIIENSSFVPVPYVMADQLIFRDTVSVSLTSTEKGGEIYYTTNGSEPSLNSKLYKGPFILNSSSVIKAFSYNAGKGKSGTITANFSKVPSNMNVKVNTQYSPYYTAGGDLGLIDGVKGAKDFRTGLWQGYKDTDLDAVVDLGSVQEVKLISVSFLQNTGSWIFLPVKIEMSVSEDGSTFNKVYETENVPAEENRHDIIKSFDKQLENIRARYIKVFGKNIGQLPSWHPSKGNKGWIFVDEITVK